MEELLRQQGGALQALGSHIIDAEMWQQMAVKLVRRTRESSTKKWHDDLDRFIEGLWGEAPLDILAMTKIDHELMVRTRGDKQR